MERCGDSAIQGGLVYLDCAELRMPRDTTKTLHRLAAHWSFPTFMLSWLSRLEVLSQRSDGVSRWSRG